MMMLVLHRHEANEVDIESIDAHESINQESPGLAHPINGVNKDINEIVYNRLLSPI